MSSRLFAPGRESDADQGCSNRGTEERAARSAVRNEMTDRRSGMLKKSGEDARTAQIERHFGELHGVFRPMNPETCGESQLTLAESMQHESESPLFGARAYSRRADANGGRGHSVEVSGALEASEE